MDLKKKDKWMLFERFKMSLYGMRVSLCFVAPIGVDGAIYIYIEGTIKNGVRGNEQKIGIEDKIKAVNGKEHSSEKVFVAMFKRIKIFTEKEN